ncbi:MAG: DoxX family membrane protein [candidate division KSB1 bacterium]|nr:DoxX family membrane protein [candidate division KSB1 bacterium]MDZ7345181.1 DoxX family membrane protein [candidate division KSB1 bacterium]
MSSSNKFSTAQQTVLVILRMLIGWHFMYEGAVKLFNPGWSSAVFLARSKWLFADYFHRIADSPALLSVVDQLNIWGLLLIGLGLFLGVFTRLAAGAGFLLLALYYVANPPIPGYGVGMPAEGSYLLVDKNLIEMFALLLFVLIPTGRLFGLEGLLSVMRTIRQSKKKALQADVKVKSAADLKRREILKSLALMPLFGGFVYAFVRKQGWESYEEKHLLAEKIRGQTDGTTGATLKTFQFTELRDLKGELPKGKIGNLEISRLFLGGNLIGGWAHARDLIYVSKLVKAYHTDRKIFDTFWLAEKAGINTILTNPQLCRVINEYWRKEKGTIQFISDCGWNNPIDGLEISIDGGACAAYVQGGIADALVEQGDLDTFEKFLVKARANGLPAGIGAHKLETVKAVVERGILPDFWVKTLHHTHYWSANIANQNDNIWCENPEETIAYMETLEQPWIAFKTLAAGAIEPKDGFSYAFRNGADFICAGMYDFQIVEDVNIVLEILSGDLSARKRPWRA